MRGKKSCGFSTARTTGLLVVVGPCSVHDCAAALDYAERLAVLAVGVAADLRIVMRVYFWLRIPRHHLVQFFSDAVSWAAIGARTTESQVHRQLASGPSIPVGFKNGTSGDVQLAVDAIRAALHPHSFFGSEAFLSGQRVSHAPRSHQAIRTCECGTNWKCCSKTLSLLTCSRGVVSRPTCGQRGASCVREPHGIGGDQSIRW